MAMDELTSRMVNGDKNAIIEGLISSSCIDNVNAITQSVLHRMEDKVTKKQLQRLKNNDTFVWGSAGVKVSHFAIAALHLLGFSEYSGSDKYVIDFIDSKFSFMT